MGKTSVAVKEKYNKKAYDDIRLRVKKGKKEEIQKKADELGKSLNSYVVDLIEEDLKKKDENDL